MLCAGRFIPLVRRNLCGGEKRHDFVIRGGATRSSPSSRRAAVRRRAAAAPPQERTRASCSTSCGRAGSCSTARVTRRGGPPDARLVHAATGLGD